jgi:hypothetical protein
MTLFECKFSSKIFDLEAFRTNTNNLEQWTKSNGVECSSNLYASENWASCITIVATYAVGGSSHFLPKHIGIPFAGKQKFYLLEMHYENPYKKNFLDHSGFRIYYTNQLRMHDAGIMTNGVSISDTQMIPPQQKSFRNIGICGPTCELNQLTTRLIF